MFWDVLGHFERFSDIYLLRQPGLTAAVARLLAAPCAFDRCEQAAGPRQQDEQQLQRWRASLAWAEPPHYRLRPRRPRRDESRAYTRRVAPPRTVLVSSIKYPDTRVRCTYMFKNVLCFIGPVFELGVDSRLLETVGNASMNDPRPMLQWVYSFIYICNN
eukprot:SAG31_NODE_13678_length_853_cov_1.836870_1_plen_160_part_00